MKLSDLRLTSDDFTDEMLTDQQAINYANEALAIINTEAFTKFPAILTIQEDYKAMPESWYRRMLSKYMSYGIKMNDGSLREAQEYKEDFERALMTFKDLASELIDDEFFDDDAFNSMFVKLPSRMSNLDGLGLNNLDK